MGTLLPIIGNLTVLDLSLPGTHDTLTYDLSETVSVGGFDDSTIISDILHYASEIGIAPGAWIRTQAQTQVLNVTQQLDNGIRFIDFRNMYTGTGLLNFDWYGLHFVQTNQKAVTYLQAIRDWMDAHPTEIIAMWLSKHGSQCYTGNDQYPNVTIPVKQAYWMEVESIFANLLVDHSRFSVNETSIYQLLQANQRVIIYAADYVEFTNSSPYALDSCKHLNNQLPGSVDSEPSSYQEQVGLFQNSPTMLAQNKASNTFFLMSMASSSPEKQLLYAFLLKFIPLDPNADKTACAALFSLPNMTNWCPSSLLDIAQLAAYYNQLSLQTSYSKMYGFPNGIYLDAFTTGGLIRTGTLDLTASSSSLQDTQTAAYAYVDTLLAWNVQKACSIVSHSECSSLLAFFNARRAQNPVQRWSDSFGRSATFPI